MIKKLSVAEYKAYMAPAPTFNMMCDQLTRTSGKHFAENLTWDWETFKKTTPLKEINFDVRASSSTAVNNGKGLQGALAGIPTHNPVQQREDALKKTIRLSNGGVAKNDIAVTYIPTRSEITGNTVPTVDGVTFYGNGANYSNGVTSSNDMDTSNDVNSSRRILLMPITTTSWSAASLVSDPSPLLTPTHCQAMYLHGMLALIRSRLFIPLSILRQLTMLLRTKLFAKNRLNVIVNNLDMI